MRKGKGLADASLKKPQTKATGMVVLHLFLRSSSPGFALQGWLDRDRPFSRGTVAWNILHRMHRSSHDMSELTQHLTIPEL